MCASSCTNQTDQITIMQIIRISNYLNFFFNFDSKSENNEIFLLSFSNTLNFILLSLSTVSNFDFNLPNHI